MTTNIISYVVDMEHATECVSRLTISENIDFKKKKYLLEFTVSIIRYYITPDTFYHGIKVSYIVKDSHDTSKEYTHSYDIELSEDHNDKWPFFVLICNKCCNKFINYTVGRLAEASSRKVKKTYDFSIPQDDLCAVFHCLHDLDSH